MRQDHAIPGIQPHRLTTVHGDPASTLDDRVTLQPDMALELDGPIARRVESGRNAIVRLKQSDNSGQCIHDDPDDGYKNADLQA